MIFCPLTDARLKKKVRYTVAWHLGAISLRTPLQLNKYASNFYNLKITNIYESESKANFSLENSLNIVFTIQIYN